MIPLARRPVVPARVPMTAFRERADSSPRSFHMLTRMNAAVLILAVLIGVWTVRPLRLVAQVPADSVLDEILDRYVRDGLVYYAALRRERGALDRYVASLVSRPEGFEEWSIERQRVFHRVLRTLTRSYCHRTFSGGC